MPALVWYGCITQQEIDHVQFVQFDEKINSSEYQIAIEAAKKAVNEKGLKG